MFSRLFPLLLLVPIIVAGIWFLFFSPALPKFSGQTPSVTPLPTQPIAAEKDSPPVSTPDPDISKALPAIKASIALQFNIPEDKITIVKSEEKEWKDTCFDIVIPGFQCEKK
jgi:hypothetical protein